MYLAAFTFYFCLLKGIFGPSALLFRVNALAAVLLPGLSYGFLKLHAKNNDVFLFFKPDDGECNNII